MNHGERVDQLIKDLQKRGCGRYTAAPPLHRLLWRMGWHIRPPHFQHFLTLFLGAGLCFAVAWGLLMWVVVWSRDGVGLVETMVAAAGTGALFGVTMATYYRSMARKFGLSNWEDYPNA